MEDLQQLLTLVARATTFEQIADALLDALFRVGGLGLDDPDIRLLRGGVYLGRSGGLRGSLCRDAATRTTTEGRIPSRTALRLVEETGEPVLIHVASRWVAPARWDHPLGQRADEEELPETQPVGTETRVLLRDSDATHIYALPLRRQGRIEGVVTLEWQALNEPEHLPIWEMVHEPIGLAVHAVAANLLLAPFAEVRDADLALGVPVIGRVMRPVLAQLDRFAKGDEAVLLTGPSGVGKSTIAEWIHRRSPRFRGPFRTLHLHKHAAENMSAYLFGWEKGAFTGADRAYVGEVAQAERGTLFLDEIGELHLSGQAQLLQFLQTRTYRRLGQVGGDLCADVRIVAATNQDLEALVAAGRFREDLYYRLARRPVDVPGLDERVDEIPEWARLMARRSHERRFGRVDVDLSADAVAALCAARWPGNLHALSNAVGAAYDLAVDGDPDGPVLIQAEHVRSAHRARRTAMSRLDAAMRAAAVAWLDALTQRPQVEQLRWRSARSIFRSYLLTAAIERWGSPEGYLRLGEETRVRGNNHSKELRAALDELAAFRAKIDS